MRRIHSYNLALLFYFLQGRTLSIPYVSKRIPKETLDSLFDNLEDIVNGSSSPQDTLFCREEQNGCYIVSVQEPQKHRLKDYLGEYCTELVNDRLETRTKNVFTWSFVRQKFIKRLAPYNLNYFIDSNIYDMPQLAPELIKLHDNGGYKLEIEINAGIERISERSFTFECSLNLSGIVEEQEKAPSLDITQEKLRRKNFQRNQQRLFDYFRRKANEKTEFSKYDLRNIVPLRGNVLNSAISRLNKQYKEIYNTKEKLIEFDRQKGMYILNNIWGSESSD